MAYKLFFILLILPFLLACQANEEVTIRLVQENKEDIVIEAKVDDFIALPMEEKENHFFLGWSDGEDYFYNDYRVEGEIELSAQFESIEDAFEIIDYEDGKVIFRNFIGESKHIVIPHRYNDALVKTIVANTFENSEIETIKIPNTVVNVGFHAFKDAKALKTVEFYGDMLGYMNFQMPSSEVEELMQNYGCELDTSEEPTEEDPWLFPEGCPITKITEKTPTVTTPSGDELFSYKGVIDLSVDDSSVIQVISEFAFSGASALEKIVLPKNIDFFNPFTFEDNIHLKEIILDENNELYTVVDNIIYSKDLTELYFYPQGLEAESFVIPNHVQVITDFVFFNSHLETITIHENVDGLRGLSFFGLNNLKEVLVSDESIRFTSEDGILYDYEGTTLLYYPAGKEATEYTVDENVMFIDRGAFANQQHLESINLPEGLIYINSHAFYQIDNISSYELPSTVQSIGNLAFYHEEDIVQELIINNTDDVLAAGANFLNFHEDLKIYISSDLVFDYNNSSMWIGYEDSFIPLSEVEE
ncbi:MAG: leucine-rich repeat protein [Candidatus Izemoplasmatales bacterium]